MQQPENTLDPQIAKNIAEKAVDALTTQSELEWWPVLLECFYGSNSTEIQTERIPRWFPN